MKPLYKILIAIGVVAVIAVTAILGFSKCDRGGGQLIDRSKTQVYLRYYEGGLGAAWMDAAIEAFEKQYAEHSFENGKKGVQIMKDYIKSAETAELVKDSINNVYITENINYYDFASKGVMLDITDIVNGEAATGPNTTESGKTILSKMSDARRNYYDYNIETGNAAKYYAVPYYESSVGLIYNVDLFEEKGWYLLDGKSTKTMSEAELDAGETVYNLFTFSDPEGKKSAGPDGEYNTSDDGLPATYNDFRALLTMIKWSGAYSFISNGYTDYFTSCATEIWATASGLDEMSLNLSFEGKSSTLLDLDANGKIQYNEDGTLKMLPETDIVPGTAYMIHRQKGKLDAIKFVKMMMNSTYYADSWSPSFSHRMAQKAFINGYENGSIDKEVAMLIDGSWWNIEAITDYSGEERSSKRFAYMPIPKPDESQIGENTVRVSERDSLMFINSATPASVVPAAKAFLSFLQSDDLMSLFTVYTDVLRGMNYEISDDDLEKMTYFGRDNYLNSRSEKTDWLEWVPASKATKLNTSLINVESWGFNNGTSTSRPFTFFKDNKGVSCEDYYSQIVNYYKSSWSVK